MAKIIKTDCYGLLSQPVFSEVSKSAYTILNWAINVSKCLFNGHYKELSKEQLDLVNLALHYVIHQDELIPKIEKELTLPEDIDLSDGVPIADEVYLEVKELPETELNDHEREIAEKGKIPLEEYIYELLRDLEDEEEEEEVS